MNWGMLLGAIIILATLSFCCWQFGWRGGKPEHGRMFYNGWNYW